MTQNQDLGARIVVLEREAGRCAWWKVEMSEMRFRVGSRLLVPLHSPVWFVVRAGSR